MTSGGVRASVVEKLHAGWEMSVYVSRSRHFREQKAD